MDDLEPTDPAEGVEMYIDHRRREGFGYFVRWCDEKGIDNLNELTGRVCEGGAVNPRRLFSTGPAVRVHSSPLNGPLGLDLIHR